MSSFQHQQKIDFFRIVNYKFPETIRHHVSGLRVASVSDVCDEVLSLKSSTDSGIDTLWSPPARTDTHDSVGLMSDETLATLLDDDSFSAWGNHDVNMSCYPA